MPNDDIAEKVGMGTEQYFCALDNREFQGNTEVHNTVGNYKFNSENDQLPLAQVGSLAVRGTFKHIN